jgi:tetratricopeptide (TPR) repeat protein
VERGLALATGAIALLPPKGDAIIRAHVWRSHAFEKHGQIGLAAIDAAAALHHLGYADALDSLEKSDRKNADLKALEQLHESPELAMSASDDMTGSRHDVRSVTTALVRTVTHVPSAAPPPLPSAAPPPAACPKMSTEFKYALLCYAGALLQDAEVEREEEACRCYIMAQKLLPKRLEAHMNLGNLRRQRMQYIGCIDAYIAALEAMLEEEAAAGLRPLSFDLPAAVCVLYHLSCCRSASSIT